MEKCERKYRMAQALLERRRSVRQELSWAPYDLGIDRESLESREQALAENYRKYAKKFEECHTKWPLSHLPSLPKIETSIEEQINERKRQEKESRKNMKQIMYPEVYKNN
jgi:hypothetical protein